MTDCRAKEIIDIRLLNVSIAECVLASPFLALIARVPTYSIGPSYLVITRPSQMPCAISASRILAFAFFPWWGCRPNCRDLPHVSRNKSDQSNGSDELPSIR